MCWPVCVDRRERDRQRIIRWGVNVSSQILRIQNIYSLNRFNDWITISSLLTLGFVVRFSLKLHKLCANRSLSLINFETIITNNPWDYVTAQFHRHHMVVRCACETADKRKPVDIPTVHRIANMQMKVKRSESVSYVSFQLHFIHERKRFFADDFFAFFRCQCLHAITFYDIHSPLPFHCDSSTSTSSSNFKIASRTFTIINCATSPMKRTAEKYILPCPTSIVVHTCKERRINARERHSKECEMCATKGSDEGIRRMITHMLTTELGLEKGRCRRWIV